MTAQPFFTTTPEIPDSRFVVTNYEAAVRRLDELLAVGWDVIILDECQAIKNRKAQRTKAMYALCRDVPYVWLLTGTPVQNRPDELWSLLHCLDPERFSSYWRFVEMYCHVYDTPWGRKIAGPKNLDRLRDELATCFLRRDRNVVDLPDVTEQTIFLEMPSRQRDIYDRMESEFLVVLDAERYVYAPSVLAQLTRLRQITCTPALIGGPDESCKTEALLELLEDYAPDHKLLCFTSFAQYVERLVPLLRQYSPVRLTGADRTADRWRAVETFQNDPECRVLVGTTGAMSEGLNLQAADIVVFLDLDWVPAVIDQAVSRARRRGREAPVHVIKLAAAGSVDEHIMDVLERKIETITEMDALALIADKIRESFGKAIKS